MDKELLFKSRLPEADVEIEGVGTIRVRGLSRAEVMAMKGVEGVEAIERRMLLLGLVDPKLTEGEVDQWYTASPASEIEPVTLKISELSGMTEDAAKAAYKEFESDPDGEFRLPPG